MIGKRKFGHRTEEDGKEKDEREERQDGLFRGLHSLDGSTGCLYRKAMPLRSYFVVLETDQQSYCYSVLVLRIKHGVSKS